MMRYILLLEQDKSSDFVQKPPFGDRKYSNTLPQKRGIQAVHPTYSRISLLMREEAPTCPM